MHIPKNAVAENHPNIIQLKNYLDDNSNINLFKYYLVLIIM